MIPVLYRESETQFLSNGIGQLTESLVAEVTEGRNGVFDLYLEYPASGIWADKINEFKYIQVKPNDVDEEHAFIIYDVIKKIDPDTIEVYATSKATHDLARDTIEKVTGTNVTPEEAMGLLKANSILGLNYEFKSDIKDKKNVEWEFRNPASCISGSEGSLVDLYGGELKKTNSTITLYRSRGKKNAAEIRQDKNLDGFQQTVSIKGLTTKILPYFKYRDNDTERDITVVGDVVTSNKADRYPSQFIKPVDFSNDDDITDKSSLDAKASTYFTAIDIGVDTPDVEVEVDLYQLSNSPDYYKFKDLEKISICDTVTTWVEVFDIDVEVKVRELKYDVLAEEVISIAAGSKSSSLNESYRKDYQDKVEEVSKSDKAQVEGNISFRRETEPTEGMIDGDSWYQPWANGTRLYIYDGIEWVFMGELTLQ